ncbi:AraC family transcriptional regulator [Scopulibacillus darangshiensis]|uniref:AraC family transcriptional regulator n=1 Tax=Scopulibacillus darangshiensis TaxID=442528 RepID=A0A4R2NRC5_9BACL|nr:AraC family transcriptional regulator [Scopulibacillus darangshiensis]TCP24479.1 AraC family transcriptional regulator [Scopulibacillus darangshiensis]
MNEMQEYQIVVQKVVQEIRNNLENKITMDELAGLAHYSPYHFNRIFKGVMGIPPKRFLGALRIEKSKDLLEKTSKSITDICLDVGYSSLTTFSNLFTKEVGLSPLKYKKGNRLIKKDHTIEADKIIGRLTGSIIIPNNFNGKIFMGVFPTSIPQGKPRHCIILKNGPFFNINLDAKGKFYLLAVAIPDNNSECSDLRGKQKKYVASYGPFTTSDGPVNEYIDLTFHLQNPTDPPILTGL